MFVAFYVLLTVAIHTAAVVFVGVYDGQELSCQTMESSLRWSTVQH